MRKLLLAGLVLLAGCRFGIGPRIEDYPARSADGLQGELTAARVRELLEVRDTAFIVLSNQRVMHIPFRRITNVNFRNALVVRMATPADFTGRQHMLRLMSRFPFGMTPDVLQRLLQAYNQSELVRVE
jgi:hypothetical protein